MNRQKFLGIAGGTYLFSDKSNYVRSDSKQADLSTAKLTADERLILFLASLAPSGHNTQPCFIKHRGPFRWLVGNDKKRWLPGVDPTQRETILSIGAFLQNMEYAASSLGYVCRFDTLAKSNQDKDVVSVKLTKSGQAPAYDMQRIINRRTVRSNYLSTPLKTADLTYLVNSETDFIHALPNYVKEHRWLNEQTIEANRIRSYRDVARRELADWIRFSGDDAATHRDGLTTAGMEIDGVPGWVLRNFYRKSAVMKPAFRDQSIDAVRKEVVNSAGGLLITSKGNDVATLLDTG